MEKYCIAVFDVGKTNKKLLIFDRELNILDSAYASVPEIDQDGVLREDMTAIQDWYLQQLKRYAAAFPIRAISVSAHGATCAAVKGDGSLATPVVSYTTEIDEAFNDAFYNTVGDYRSLQEITGTPRFDGLLNVGKTIYFMQRKFPDQFSETANILGYAQYFGYWLTGSVGAEPTYVGCHTYLWDFQRRSWSGVADRLGIVDKLAPKVVKSWDVLGTVKPEVCAATGLREDTLVTMGIHDSNAALLPYLIKTPDDFVLNSTGTWCVVMHPTKEISFSKTDIGKVVFYNLDAFFNPVKTAIFVGGLEFETYTGILKDLNGQPIDTHYDQDFYRQFIDQRRCFILPEIFSGSGQFPDSEARAVEDGQEFLFADIQSAKVCPGFFKDSRKAMAALELSLATQTKVALERTGFRDGMSLFIEGGFRMDESYNSLLTALYPRSKIARTGMKEASAFGAAMLGKIAWEGVEPETLRDCYDIEFSPVERVETPGLDAYIEAFLKYT